MYLRFVVDRSRGHVISDGAQPRSLHVAFYSVDTEINQSDGFKKLKIFSFTILTGY